MNILSSSTVVKTVDQIPHAAVKEWVTTEAEFLGIPLKNIQVLDKSDHERLITENSVELKTGGDAAAIQQAIKDRKLLRLPNGNYFAFSHPKDTARAEERTMVATDDSSDAGENNNWRLESEIRPEVDKRMKAAIAADLAKNPDKPYYLIPQLMSPEGCEVSRVVMQITDSWLVALNVNILTRVGAPAWRTVEKRGDFFKGVHITGDLENLRRHPEGKEGEDDRYFVAFPKTDEARSFGSAYGGNAILGKIFIGLRLLMWAGIRDGVMTDENGKKHGWSAEHTMIGGIKDKTGDYADTTFWYAGAFPSQSGKTNLAMRKVPPALSDISETYSLSDDLGGFMYAQGKPVHVVNEEDGQFPVMPGTNPEKNYNCVMAVTDNTGTIFSNIALNLRTGEVWWEDLTTDRPATSTDPNDDGYWWVDWQAKFVHERPEAEQNAKEFPWAHPNSRGTTALDNIPNLPKGLKDDPEGVPLDAMFYGGRSESDALEPLIRYIGKGVEGIYDGAMMIVQTTPAKEGAIITRPDPMAQAPFMSVKAGLYFEHLLNMREVVGEEHWPAHAHVNWFRKIDGKILWPGFEANDYPVRWVREMIAGKAKAVRTPMGWIPTEDAFVHLPGGSMIDPRILSWDVETWLAEMDRRDSFMDEYLQTDNKSHGHPKPRLPAENPIPKAFKDATARIRHELLEYMNYTPDDPLADLQKIIADYTIPARERAENMASDPRAQKLVAYKKAELEDLLTKLESSQEEFSGDVSRDQVVRTIKALL